MRGRILAASVSSTARRCLRAWYRACWRWPARSYSRTARGAFDRSGRGCEGRARCAKRTFRKRPLAATTLRQHARTRVVAATLHGGRHFLVGERFSAADLTFASLAGPVLLPAGCRASYPEVDEVPATMREEVLRLRETEAGRFAMRLFSQERVRSQTGT